MALNELRRELKALSDPVKAAFFSHFFKTGPGEYGEGDRFRGIPVPKLRKLARAFRNLSLRNAEELLNSEFHEDRLLSLFLLVQSYQKEGVAGKNRIHRLYIRKMDRVNNWDLVDSSATQIVGAHQEGKNPALILKLAKNRDLWRRRIAMIACFDGIRKMSFGLALKIATLLLRDEEDLIHKAVGWMLREIGKRDGMAERKFLNRHAARMPRTMLRYAIERFPKTERKRYLAMRIRV